VQKQAIVLTGPISFGPRLTLYVSVHDNTAGKVVIVLTEFQIGHKSLISYVFRQANYLSTYVYNPYRLFYSIRNFSGRKGYHAYMYSVWEKASRGIDEQKEIKNGK